MGVEPKFALRGPCGISHVGVATPDLDRFRTFYEDTIGLETAVVFGSGPGHARQAVLLAGTVMLHAFEVPGYDPTAHGFSGAMFERGRLDHIGFTVSDTQTLAAVRDRLLAVDATSGDIRPLGQMLSLRFRDPDGLESEINCYDHTFDPSTMRAEDEIGAPGWLGRIRQLLHADAVPGLLHTANGRSGDRRDAAIRNAK